MTLADARRLTPAPGTPNWRATMPAPKRVMLSPDLESLRALGRDIGPTKNESTGESEWREPTAAINGALAEYAFVIERAARDLDAVLTRREWNAIADVMNGCADLYDYGGPQMSPLLMVTANLQDTPGLHKKWKVDVPDLCRRLSALTAVHGYAILAAVRWFWSHPADINHAKDEWWTPVFRRPPAANGE